uniref:Odorant receptor n=1 Tax=Cephus cinctus TaxID=211228 RepID=A0A1W6L1J6_CEPCN|nr:odorant receptor 48 [Cephus cinctus]
MDISGATIVLKWNEWLLDFLGLWPLNLNNAKFSFFFIYIIIQCFLQYAALVDNIFDLSYVVANLTETVVFCMIVLKLVIYRINMKRLHELIRIIKEDYSHELYKTAKERMIFMKYNSLSRMIVQCFSILCVCAAVLFYIQPLICYLLAYRDSTGNSSSAFVLPYHIRLFFNLTEARTYYIIYACEILIIPMSACGYVGPSCLLITLVLHICGQLSILATQVECMTYDPKTIQQQLKQIVIKHSHLISLCATLNSTYSIFLLQEVIGITVLLCLGSYNITETGEFLTFSCYVFTVFVQLLGFCYMGECLVNESINLCDAFYNYEWYNASAVHRKLLLMCLIRSQRPLVLTAGKFFTFSLENFTSVTRNLLINFSPVLFFNQLALQTFLFAGYENINGLFVGTSKIHIKQS